MARRRIKSLWPALLQRSLGAFTRAALRAGTRVAVKAAKKAVRQATRAAAKPAVPRKPVRKTVPNAVPKAVRKTARPAVKPAARATAPPAGMTRGVAVGAHGARRYLLFTPSGARETALLPLLVMLHGCGQDAGSFAASTRMNRIAAREGFIVLWPEQERVANSQGCWNWFDTRAGRAYGEAASIVTAIDQVCALHGADARRVAVVGLSAGASLAALLATRHPERFCAVAMHSGIAPGAAHSTATALGAMQGRRRPTPLPITAAGAAGLPPLLVIQGAADTLVRPSNGHDAVALWAAASVARATAPRTVQRGQRHPVTVIDFKAGGRLVATLCEVAQLGHAWSGGAAGQPYSDAEGPDASRMVWAFVGRHLATPTPPAPPRPR